MNLKRTILKEPNKKKMYRFHLYNVSNYADQDAGLNVKVIIKSKAVITKKIKITFSSKEKRLSSG